mmetsp:Transcript_571/g.1932  ORF Transcript_571/g.1932 Transcript_571/m.1932 type:complete len:1167 (-) Transcript_571:220-3720(-)
MGWGDPDELVELHGASGKTWQLRFMKRIGPREGSSNASSMVHTMREVGPGSHVFVAKTQFADTGEEMEDLVSEAANWRRISVANQNRWPPNVVELKDVFITRGEDSSVVYLMEFCQRGNLPRRMPDAQVGEVLKSVAMAVKATHDSGIRVHGNVTYSTVMVAADNTIKLAGFGAGRASILRSYPDLTPADDIFGIGKLGFELLIGRPPGSQETHLPPNVPASQNIRDAIDSAMAHPQQRPTITAFLALLRGGGGPGASQNQGYGGPAGLGQQMPPQATASIRRGNVPINMAGSQAPPTTQARTSLMDAVNTQQSLRGAVPGLSQSGAVMGAQNVAQMTMPGRQSLLNTVSGVQAATNSDSNGVPQPTRFSPFDPFGLATRQAVPGEKIKETASLVEAITSPSLEPLNTAALQNLQAQLKELRNAPDVYRVLFKRPISTEPIVAMKTLVMIHLLMIEGTLEFIDMTLRQKKFMDWIQQSWSASTVQQNMDKHKFNFAFINGEISQYAEFLGLKALFHFKTAYAFNGDWSRSTMLNENGEDPVKGRERKIMSGMTDVMDRAEDVASKLMSSNDPCRSVKLIAVPGLVSEIIRGYESVCGLVDAVPNLNTRRKLVPAYEKCHYSAKNVLQAVKMSQELSSRLPADIVNMEIDDMPQDIAAEPQPAPPAYEEPPVEYSYEEGPNDGSFAGEKLAGDEGSSNEKEKKKKKKKKDREEGDSEVASESQKSPEIAEGTTEANIATDAPPEGAVVPYQENKIGLLVRYSAEHEGQPEEDVPPERAENPHVENAALLADIMGETQEADGYARDGASSSWALTLTDEAREQEKENLREARERSAAYSMALTVVGEAPTFQKTHPAFCQCTMCQTTTSVQNMTIYGAEEEGSKPVEGARVENGREVPEKYRVTAKDVKIGQQIGEGGFGAVYKGKYKRKEVAIKKIAKHFLQNDVVYDALVKEVVLMCSLDHPNVLKLVGASTKKSNFLILTEYMTRGSLFDMIHKARARLNWSIVKRLAIATASGMSYLHASKILHRDLKTANIMVDADFSVRIGDFGIAVVLSADEDDGSHLRHGFAGTYQYMAPEIIAKQPYTEKSDVYSFGMVLWEMVSMQLPFVGLAPEVAADQVLNGGLRPQIPPFCPQPLAVVISSCWNQEPTLRPSFPQLIELMKRIPG